MEQKPLVSIIVNCLNGQKYLKNCLNSIKNQTFKNFELIFWDNHSTDTSRDIFFSYKDKRFKYFKSKFQTTLYKARNEAIEKTIGEYICFLDTDDYWMKEKLEKQLKIFDEKKDSDIVYSNQIIYDETKEKKHNFLKKINTNFTESEKILNRQGITILNAIFTKKSYKNLKKGFDENYNVIGDLDFFYRLSKKVKAEYINEPLAVYRLHEKNYSKLNKLEEINELKKWYKEVFLKISFENINEKKIIENAIMLREIIYLLLNNNRIKSLSKILLFKNSFLKLKLFFAIFIPNYILKKYLKF